MKIIKNNTLSPITINGSTIPSMSQLEIPVTEYSAWATSTVLISLISSGDVIVNNGEYDLPIDVGIDHMSSIGGVVAIHDNIEVFPVTGELAPEIYEVGPAVVGYRMQINDKIYANAKYDRISGSKVIFEIHCCVDNTIADRWVAFDLYTIVSDGNDSQVMSGYDLNATFGPFLIPTVSNKMFKISAELPSELFTSNRRYVFSSGTRIDVAPLGKTNPVNDPVILQICRVYYRKAN